MSNDVKKKIEAFIPLIEKQEALFEFTQYLFPTFYEYKIDADFMQKHFGYIGKEQENIFIT